jgi:hypothetical protein
VQVDEAHAAAETRNRAGNLLLSGGGCGLSPAPFLERMDVALERAVQAFGLWRIVSRAAKSGRIAAIL